MPALTVSVEQAALNWASSIEMVDWLPLTEGRIPVIGNAHHEDAVIPAIGEVDGPLEQGIDSTS